MSFNWSNFRGENWRASPYFNVPSQFSYQPYEQRPLNYAPQRTYNPYIHQREHFHPASQYGHLRPAAPYQMPPQYYQQRVEESVFITPNAGMAENAKICKSDVQPEDTRKRFEAFEDFSSDDEKITVDTKCSSAVCTVIWSLSSKFNSARYHILVELYLEGKLVDKANKDLRANSCQFQTLPGHTYTADVLLIQNSDNKIRLKEPKTFKAIFSPSEINELYKLAVAFTGKEPIQRFKYLYRVKPQVYFDDIVCRTCSIMEKYIKDENGHRASPINGEIRGLFWSGQLYNGFFPPRSPFGDRRFYISTERLMIPESVNVYFADFYCNSVPHYVTIVVCKKNSPTDNFCKKHIKLLNFYDNPYFKVEVVGGTGIQYNYYVNDCVHVEICYTENVHLSDGYFEDVIAMGIGSSRVGGLRNKDNCPTCNLKKSANVLLSASTLNQPKLPDLVERSPSPEPPCSQHPNQSDNLNGKRSAATSTPVINDEPAKKRVKIESKSPTKQTPLRKLIDSDRLQRNYAEPNQEVVEVVSELIESVGTQIDFENFTKKISPEPEFRGSALTAIGSLLYSTFKFFKG